MDSLVIKNDAIVSVPDEKYIISKQDFAAIKSLILKGSNRKTSILTCKDVSKDVYLKVKFINTLTRSGNYDHSGPLNQFFRETTYLKNIQHPNIVKIFELVSIPIDNYDLPGFTMENLLPIRTKLTVKEIMLLTTNVSSALDHVHALGYVHFDIKSTNIMYRDTRNSAQKYVLIDFGSMVKIGDQKFQPPDRISKQFSDPQHDSLEQGSAFDQYSLALTILELLDPDYYCRGHNRNFFSNKSKKSLRLSPVLNEGLVKIFQRATSYHRQDRYPTCGEFVKNLCEVLLHLT